MPTRGGSNWVPRELCVEVRVHINETGRHQSSVSIKRALCRSDVVTNRNNRVAIDRYISPPRFGTQTIDNQSPTDHHIMHVETVPVSCQHSPENNEGPAQ